MHHSFRAHARLLENITNITRDTRHTSGNPKWSQAGALQSPAAFPHRWQTLLMGMLTASAMLISGCATPAAQTTPRPSIAQSLDISHEALDDIGLVVLEPANIMVLKNPKSECLNLDMSWDLSYTPRYSTLDNEATLGSRQGFESLSVDVYFHRRFHWITVKRGDSWNSKAELNNMLDLAKQEAAVVAGDMLLNMLADALGQEPPESLASEKSLAVDPDLLRLAKRTMASGENRIHKLVIRIDDFRIDGAGLELGAITDLVKRVEAAARPGAISYASRYLDVVRYLAMLNPSGEIRWTHPDADDVQVGSRNAIDPRLHNLSHSRKYRAVTDFLRTKTTAAISAELSIRQLLSSKESVRRFRSYGFDRVILNPETTSWPELRDAVFRHKARWYGNRPANSPGRDFPDEIVVTESLYRTCRSLYAHYVSPRPAHTSRIPWSMDLDNSMISRQLDALNNFSFYTLEGQIRTLPEAVAQADAVRQRLLETFAIRPDAIQVNALESTEPPPLKKVVIRTIEDVH